MKNSILLLFLFISTAGFAQQDTVFFESGLRYIQLKKGNDKKPTAGQKVKVSYIGKFSNGETFQALEEGESFSFKIGDPDIIQGWNEGFQKMGEGEKGILIVPPYLGYGTKGMKDPFGEKEYMIPPNSTLYFEVTLFSVK